MSEFSEEQQTLLMTRGMIAGLPESAQRDVRIAADMIRKVIQTYDASGLGLLALALVGAEYQCSTAGYDCVKIDEPCQPPSK